MRAVTATDGDKLTVSREVTWNRVWNGSEITSTFYIKGDRILFKSAPFVAPQFGQQIVATLVWQRVK